MATDLLIFQFGPDDIILRQFIRGNFCQNAADTSKIEITRNNFIAVYHKWRKAVKDSININWENAKLKGILDADFFLADLLAENNITIEEKLFVLLKADHYEFDRTIDELMGTLGSRTAIFGDQQKAHKLFWNIYERPPREEFWDFIVTRKDLLVPQDVR